MISDDPQRSAIVLLPNASGLPYPVFVNPHYARVLGSLAAAEWLPGITRSLYGGWPLGKTGKFGCSNWRRMGDRDDRDSAASSTPIPERNARPQPSELISKPR